MECHINTCTPPNMSDITHSKRICHLRQTTCMTHFWNSIITHIYCSTFFRSTEHCRYHRVRRIPHSQKPRRLRKFLNWKISIRCCLVLENISYRKNLIQPFILTADNLRRKRKITSEGNRNAGIREDESEQAEFLIRCQSREIEKDSIASCIRCFRASFPVRKIPLEESVV